MAKPTSGVDRLKLFSLGGDKETGLAAVLSASRKGRMSPIKMIISLVGKAKGQKVRIELVVKKIRKTTQGLKERERFKIEDETFSFMEVILAYKIGGVSISWP